MDKKLIIHIGYPKTATTTLQLNLFSDLYVKGEIEYLNHLNNDTNGYLGNYYIRNTIYSIVTNKVIENFAIQNELKKLKSINKSISLISAEYLSIWYPGFNYSIINSNARNNAKIIKEKFSNYFNEIEVIIGIRNHPDIIRGIYKESYHQIVGDNPKYSSFKHWLNVNFIKNKDIENLAFNYDTLISNYINIFGKENVKILIYEELLYNKNEYYKVLSNIFDVEISLIKKSLEKDIKNSSIVDDNGDIEAKNPIIGEIITKPFRHNIKKYFSENTYHIYKNVFNTIIPNFIYGKQINKTIKIRKYSDEEVFLIKQKYNNSNINFIIKNGLDKNKMKEYGYI